MKSVTWMMMNFWIWTIFYMNSMMTILVKKDFISSKSKCLFPMPAFSAGYFHPQIQNHALSYKVKTNSGIKRLLSFDTRNFS